MLYQNFACVLACAVADDGEVSSVCNFADIEHISFGLCHCDAGGGDQSYSCDEEVGIGYEVFACRIGVYDQRGAFYVFDCAAANVFDVVYGEGACGAHL